MRRLLMGRLLLMSPQGRLLLIERLMRQLKGRARRMRRMMRQLRQLRRPLAGQGSTGP